MENLQKPKIRRSVSHLDSCTSMLVLAGVDKTCQRLLVAILVEAYGRR